MSTYIWLSFDFVKISTRQHFYTWLANNDALECGANVAFLRYACSDVEKICNELLEDLQRTMSFQEGDRLYCVARNKNGSYVGRFIVGSRQPNPWGGNNALDVS